MFTLDGANTMWNNYFINCGLSPSKPFFCGKDKTYAKYFLKD
jgi:hypothetical protein